METINAIENLSTLASMLRLTGLEVMLNSDGPFTVFAPNNDAFSEIPEDALAELLKPENLDWLKIVLLRHIVGCKTYYQPLMVAQAPKGDTTLDTVGGEKITLNNADEITIKSTVGKATVIKSDIFASYGVVNIVDSVFNTLKPQNYTLYVLSLNDNEFWDCNDVAKLNTNR